MKPLLSALIGLSAGCALVYMFTHAPCNDQCKIGELAKQQEDNCMWTDGNRDTIIDQDCMKIYEDQIAAISTKGD